MCRVVCLLGAAAGASGRDLWLEAEPGGTGKPAVERTLHLRGGEAGKSEEELSLQKDRTTRFDLYADLARKKDLLAAGQAGQSPVAKLPPDPSACLVVMDRKEPSSNVDAEHFNRILAETGQEAVTAQRTRSGQNGAEGKEAVFEYLKALVPGQDPSSTLPNTLYKRRIEQRLEILLQNNPGRLAANRRLTVKVLFDGKPLAGAKVFAYRREVGGISASAAATPTPTAAATNENPGAGGVSAVTSAQGLAEFKLEPVGPWLVEVTHVRAGPERKNNPNGAWESLVATYSFVTRDAPSGQAAIPGRTQGGGDGK